MYGLLRASATCIEAGPHLRISYLILEREYRFGMSVIFKQLYNTETFQ